MKRALLVIDVQNEYFTGKMPVSYPSGSLDHILQAMDSARAHGVPVVVVRHTAKGRPWSFQGRNRTVELAQRRRGPTG